MGSTTREQILQRLTVEPAGLSAPELMRRIRPRISQPTLWRTLDSLRAEQPDITRRHASTCRRCAACDCIRSRRDALHRIRNSGRSRIGGCKSFGW
jgi:Fe2+ or Zn2+ uptake regulation protein